MVSALYYSAKMNFIMNIVKKAAAEIFPFYKKSLIKKENKSLFVAIISSLPERFDEIKTQTLSSRFFGLNDWLLFPEFKFVTMSYAPNTYYKYKKRGKNFKLSGMQIFSNYNNRFEEIEILIQHNLLIGLRIVNCQYQLGEFDHSSVHGEKAIAAEFTFPKTEVEILYDSLAPQVKDQLALDDLGEIEFNNRTFYSFYDLEDGNCLAIDKNFKVYSLVHDAKPMATQMKNSLEQILSDIKNNKFDKVRHLEERYRNSR